MSVKVIQVNKIKIMKITEKNIERYRTYIDRYRVLIENIRLIVCKAYDNDENIVNTRQKEYCNTRQITHYFANMYTIAPFVIIGYLVGDLDHATAMHSVEIITNYRKQYRKVNEDLTYLEDYIEKSLGVQKIDPDAGLIRMKRRSVVNDNIHEYYRFTFDRFTKVI